MKKEKHIKADNPKLKKLIELDKKSEILADKEFSKEAEKVGFTKSQIGFLRNVCFDFDKNY